MDHHILLPSLPSTPVAFEPLSASSPFDRAHNSDDNLDWSWLPVIVPGRRLLYIRVFCVRGVNWFVCQKEYSKQIMELHKKTWQAHGKLFVRLYFLELADFDIHSALHVWFLYSLCVTSITTRLIYELVLKVRRNPHNITVQSCGSGTRQAPQLLTAPTQRVLCALYSHNSTKNPNYINTLKTLRCISNPTASSSAHSCGWCNTRFFDELSVHWTARRLVYHPRSASAEFGKAWRVIGLWCINWYKMAYFEGMLTQQGGACTVCFHTFNFASQWAHRLFFVS
jgi:hypothetical protein